MSKKLIAVAAAAALALTGLVAAPAYAAVDADYADALGPITPAATALLATADVDVPANNKLEFTDTAGRSSLMEVTVNVTAGQTVSVTTTGKVRVIDEETDSTNKYTSASGTTTYSEKATGATVIFYAYTTGTDAGSLTTTVGGNSTQVFFKGNPGEAYNLAVTFPTGVPTSGTSDVTAILTDVFGNVAGTTETVTGEGAGIGFGSITSLTWDGTDENWQGTITGSAIAGPVAVSYSLSSDPDDVAGLAKAVKSAFRTLDTASLSAQITTLTAQVAALQVIVDRKVSKKRFNTLARKWNAANPSDRVALKR